MTTKQKELVQGLIVEIKAIQKELQELNVMLHPLLNTDIHKATQEKMRDIKERLTAYQKFVKEHIAGEAACSCVATRLKEPCQHDLALFNLTAEELGA